MAKKSGKSSTAAEKRKKGPKARAAVGATAAADGPTAAGVEVGNGKVPTAETAGAQTPPVDGAGSGASAPEAVAETPEARPQGQASEDAPEPAQESAPAAAGGDPAAATARPKGRGRTRVPKPRPAEAVGKPGKLSALDAAAQVLAEAGAAMTCGEMIAAMAAKGYWTSPGGKTPAATLYSAILMETRSKGTQSRFTKIERGTFGLAAHG